jgi:outer membrane immunogenic protein
MGMILTARQAIALALLMPIGILSTKAYADQWDGLFLGVNAGAARTSSEYTTGPVDFRWAEAPNVSADMWNKGRQDRSKLGPIFGLSAAYNFQFNSFVFGGELGLNAVNSEFENTATYQYTGLAHHYTYTQEADVEGLVTMRGRAGYAFGDSLLSVTGGIAGTSLRTGLNYSDDYAGSGQYTASSTEATAKVGWTAGVAYEHRLSDDIALKAEFAYVDFGSTGFTPPILAGDGSYMGGMQYSSSVHMNIFTIGLEKKF